MGWGIGALALSAVLGIVVFVLAGAVVGLHRDIEQIRDEVGLVDRPVPLSVPAKGTRPSTHGLPAALDSAEYAVVLVVADMCTTCSALLRSLNGDVPPHLLILAESRDPRRASEWLNSYGLEFGDRIVLDHGGATAESLGLNTSPAAVLIVAGLLADGSTVPSSRQLKVLLGLGSTFAETETAPEVGPETARDTPAHPGPTPRSASLDLRDCDAGDDCCQVKNPDHHDVAATATTHTNH